MASEYTTSEYIKHHLTNATMCSTDNGIAFNKACSDAGFWAWHVDTLAWSIGLGLLCRFLDTTQSREKDPGKNCNNRNHHKDLDKGKAKSRLSCW